MTECGFGYSVLESKRISKQQCTVNGGIYCRFDINLISMAIEWFKTLVDRNWKMLLSYWTRRKWLYSITYTWKCYETTWLNLTILRRNLQSFEFKIIEKRWFKRNHTLLWHLTHSSTNCYITFRYVFFLLDRLRLNNWVLFPLIFLENHSLWCMYFIFISCMSNSKDWFKFKL